jgi:hypothetical protein
VTPAPLLRVVPIDYVIDIIGQLPPSPYAPDQVRGIPAFPIDVLLFARGTSERERRNSKNE